MSLFSSLQLANNSLAAAQTGIQVVGNNIANASTPGYLRQEIVLEPAPTQRKGDLLLGLGVSVTGVIQRIDEFVEDQLRSATSDLQLGETQENTYLQLESLIGELSDTDLSSSLTNFFASIHDIANQPDSVSVRNLAVLKGQGLASDIRNLARRVRNVQGDTNQRIIGSAKEINQLVEEIARLNVQIVTTEGGDVTASDAVGLRDRQLQSILKLSEIIDIRANLQPDGSTAVYAGSELLVFAGTFNEVKVAFSTGDTSQRAEIRSVATNSALTTTSGRLAGLYEAYDNILGGFLSGLDSFAGTLAYEFNKLHTGGQGLTGFSEITSFDAVSDPSLPLDQAGLPHTPVNGSFQVQVLNTQTGINETRDIFVQLNGLNTDTDANALVADLDAIDGITAQLSASRRVEISVDSPNVEFSFVNDTSGVLAALGINTFFTGDSAANLEVNNVLVNDPSKFAASSGGIGLDAVNVESLADFLDRPLDEQGGESLAVLYDRLVGETAQDAEVARSVAEGFRVFQRTLEGRKLGISGVSIDEEAVKLIKFQRVYQASARYISVVNDLLETLVNI